MKGDDSTVCGVGFCYILGQRLWFNGNFDINLVFLRIDSIKYLGELNYTLDTQAQPPTLNTYSIDRFYSHTVDLGNGNLSDVKVTNMPHEISSPIVRDGKLFGFPVDEERASTQRLCTRSR
ncbi:hypothetical protein M3Y98_00983200 [Aphelenchoides besseyi]|nr:hypothetical protein M3Y98_00983200 [Aphelenchoides besseyi]